ncbi:MAG: T9SS type A sorting domain-containing protein [Flavobacteriaceae bacterium]|nr:T9SS type A sorting domain-containing protein [Flavobacteriaceae bacterium]
MKALFTSFLFFFAFFVNAQWTTDTDLNTLVADSEGGDMKALGGSNGNTYVVFWKSVAAPTNYELRLQILDANGNQLLGNDGSLVSNLIPMSTFTVIWNVVLDANNNLYIGATGTGGGDPAYVFKLDANGNNLWGPSGENIGSGNLVTVLPLLDGSIIASWYSGSGGLMQKIDSNGNSLWPSNQPIEIGATDTAPANLFELSGNEFALVYHKLIGGINSHLYTQKYDTNGDPVWGAAVQICNQATAFNRSYTGLQDGDVMYMGYFGSSGVRFDSFLQRINPDGTLPWGVNGSDFDTNQTNYETYTEIAFEAGSQNIWAVCNYTNTSQSDHGEYVQKFDKDTGARLLGNNAKEVYSIGSDNVHAGALQLKNDSPLFLLKKGFDNGATPTTLDVVHLDENGDFAWPEESRPVATFSASKSRIHYTKPVNHQSVAVFIENKGGGERMYAQNFLDEELSVGDKPTSIMIRYHNPVENLLFLEAEIPIKKMVVYSTKGEKLIDKSKIHKNEITINCASWTSGIYFVKIVAENDVTKTLRIIKK